MAYLENNETTQLTERQKQVMEIYKARHQANKHKMIPIPVCLIPKHFKQ
jgi:NAD+ synthase